MITRIQNKYSFKWFNVPAFRKKVFDEKNNEVRFYDSLDVLVKTIKPLNPSIKEIFRNLNDFEIRKMLDIGIKIGYPGLDYTLIEKSKEQILYNFLQLADRDLEKIYFKYFD